jgi:hypothetical protein
MRRSPWIRRAGLALLSAGLFFVPGDLLVPPSEAPVFAVAGALAAIAAVPLVLRREHDAPVALAAPVPTPLAADVARERERVLFLAIHDVRRMIQTMRPDDLLVSHIDRRLLQGVTDAGAVVRPRNA